MYSVISGVRETDQIGIFHGRITKEFTFSSCSCYITNTYKIENFAEVTCTSAVTNYVISWWETCRDVGITISFAENLKTDGSCGGPMTIILLV